MKSNHTLDFTLDAGLQSTITGARVRYEFHTVIPISNLIPELKKD
jgi:hypothetical protein